MKSRKDGGGSPGDEDNTKNKNHKFEKCRVIMKSRKDGGNKLK